MNTGKAFLNTSRTLFNVMSEFASYRIVGNTANIAILGVNVIDREAYEDVKLPVIEQLKKVAPSEFISFQRLFGESSIVLAYSWLDTYLSEVEESLFLHDPASLGENVQIKLGKLLSSGSIDEVVHDLAKRRAREKGNWSLKNRITELREKYGLSILIDEKDIEWLSDTRNNIIHNRRVGEFQTKKGKVSYKSIERKKANSKNEIDKYMSLVVSILSQLYLECACYRPKQAISDA